jgi:hypothetical protein
VFFFLSGGGGAAPNGNLRSLQASLKESILQIKYEGHVTWSNELFFLTYLLTKMSCRLAVFLHLLKSATLLGKSCTFS